MDQTAAARAKAPPVLHPVPAAKPIRTWPEVLERVRAATKAYHVVATDPEGLLLGHAGPLSLSDAEGIAAHVARAFDLVDGMKRLGGKAESVCVMYTPENTWLTATRLSAPSGEKLTIAIVGPYTLIRSDRMRIRELFFKLVAADRIVP
jgi:hypothetical protein